MFWKVLTGSIAVFSAAVFGLYQAFGPENNPERSTSPIAYAAGVMRAMEQVQYNPKPAVESVKPIPELIQRNQMDELSRYEVLNGDGLETLNKLAEPLRSGRVKGASGVWRLSFFYGGLEQANMLRYQMVEEGDRFKKIFDEWQAKNLASPTPYILKAYVLKRQAAYSIYTLQNLGEPEARHERIMEPIRQQLKTQLSRQLKVLKTYIDRPNEIAESDPGWYQVKLSALAMTCQPFEEMWSVLEAGTRKFPDYYDLYNTAFEAGTVCNSIDARTLIDMIIDLGTRRTEHIKGSGYYARAIWFLGSQYTLREVLDPAFTDWRRMKDGIGDILSVYPDVWNINHFAKFACIGGQFEIARELLPRAKSHVAPSVWSRDYTLDNCITQIQSAANAGSQNLQ